MSEWHAGPWRAAWLGLGMAALLGACASSRVLPVRVDAMSRPGYSVDKDAALCMAVAESQKSPPDLAKQVMVACRRAARGQGLRVVEPSEDTACLRAELRWYGETPPDSDEGDRCDKLFDAAVCRRTDPQLFGKALAIDLVDTTREPPQKVHDIKASMATRDPGFDETAAEALCEAAFREFPMRRMNELYEIEL